MEKRSQLVPRLAWPLLSANWDALQVPTALHPERIRSRSPPKSHDFFENSTSKGSVKIFKGH